MNLFNFFIGKPLSWAAHQVEGTEKGAADAAAITGKIQGPIQAEIDARKAQIVAALTRVADQAAAEIDAKTFDPNGLRARIHEALAGLHLGIMVQGMIEGVIYNVALPKADQATKGAVYSAAQVMISAVGKL